MKSEPPNPDELERLLAGRPRPEPSAGLRQRVLAALAEPRRPAPRSWGPVWKVAVALVVALNLAMTVANGVRYQSLQPESAPLIAATGDRFEALAANAL